MKSYIQGKVLNSNLEVVESGFIALVQSPAGNIEEIIDNSARVSYDGHNKNRKPEERRNLIRFLLSNEHTSPFEHVSFTFHVRCPIFVARQWFRHRTGKYNEISARYTEVKDHFWMVESTELRKQSATNRQCSTTETAATDSWGAAANCLAALFKVYKKLLEDGVCREQARSILPQSTMTEFYFTMDLHNLLHFLRLRMADDAQPEIRYYAEAITSIIKLYIPDTWRAFEDFILNSVTFTASEIDFIKDKLDDEWDDSKISKRERDNYEKKVKRMKH